MGEKCRRSSRCKKRQSETWSDRSHRQMQQINSFFCIHFEPSFRTTLGRTHTEHTHAHVCAHKGIRPKTGEARKKVNPQRTKSPPTTTITSNSWTAPLLPLYSCAIDVAASWKLWNRLRMHVSCSTKYCASWLARCRSMPSMYCSSALAMDQPSSFSFDCILFCFCCSSCSALLVSLFFRNSAADAITVPFDLLSLPLTRLRHTARHCQNSQNCVRIAPYSRQTAEKWRVSCVSSSFSRRALSTRVCAIAELCVLIAS